MNIPVAAVTPLCLAALLAAQGDTVTLTSGNIVEGARVVSYTIRELKYQKGGGEPVPVPSDQVAKVVLSKFRDVYRRGLADKDPDTLITETRNQLKTAKDPLMAQFGYVEAARLFYAGDKDGAGGAALEEMQKEIPDAGLLPELFRMKFDNYMSLGNAGGYQNASLVAKKYATEATTNAWPAGFSLEAEFFNALAAGIGGGDAKTFQQQMRDIASRAAGVSPGLAGRANVQLGHSLRATGDRDGARRLYQDVLDRQVADDNSRAGAYLGMGLLQMTEGDAANREPYHQALLSFLRVRLETKSAGPGLQAEALFNAMLAADKWGGQDFKLVQSRCRWLLLNNFGSSEWAARARGQ